MEEEGLLPKEDLQLLNPLTDTNPAISGAEAYKTWVSSLPAGNETASPLSIGQLPGGDPGRGAGQTTGNTQRGNANTIADKVAQANAGTLDSTQYTIKGSEMSKRYPVTYKGVDNEELYAGGQTLGQKAYNGVAKMVGTATTTFINGTVGTVYGIMSAASAEDGHKIKAFYNNDLAEYLNDINTEMEDSYAHYKTERERNGDWWEPSNLFTANFLFDNVIKNLGFSLGAMGAGFAWGGALKALGVTGRLMGTGKNMAAAADKVIADAALLPEAERLSAITRNLNSLKATAGSALMKADRGIVATFGTFGESGIEALNNAQQFREEAIKAYTAEHGYAPDREELDKIEKEAHNVGDWSFGLNTALLTATNYIQLPKIYSSAFKAEKAIANDIVLAGEKYVSSLPEKGFGKLMYKAKNIASLGFNTSEAFEEGAQFAIQTGTQNYFDRKYRGESASALEDGLLYGVKEALTTGEGTLNIFTGGFSGALQSSGIHTLGRSGKLAERGFTGYGGEQGKVRNEAITALNNTRIKDKMRDVFTNIKVAEGIQADREAAIRRGDILESKDLEFDYAHNFVTSRLKYGAKSAIDQEIDMLKEEAMTDFTSLQQQGVPASTDTKDSFIKRLDNLKAHAEHASQMYDAANLKYGGLIDKDGKKVFSDEIIDQLVYAGSKVMDYNRRIPEMRNQLTGFNVNLEQIVTDILAGKSATEATAEAKADIENKADVNADTLTQTLDDVVEASLRRIQFIKEYKDITKKPAEYKRETTVDTDTPAAIQTITEVGPDGKEKTINAIRITTRTGEKTIKLNEEYFLGNVMEKDAAGNEVMRAPKLTVLGENEDGTIKIKDNKGVVRDVTKEVFEGYKLSPVASTLKNKKAAFMMANWNTIWTHHGIKEYDPVTKTKVPVKGRLIYDEENDKDGILIFRYIDRKGKIREEEVNRHMFNPASKQYKHGMLTKFTTLTAMTEAEKEAQEKAQQEFLASTDNRAIAAIRKRMDILNELYKSVADRQASAQRLIESKTKQLENYRTELETLTKIIENKPQYDKRATNFTKFKKVTVKAIARASSVSTMIQQLENEIVEQETIISELETQQDYITDYMETIEEQPVDLRDFYTKLRYEKLLLEDAINSTSKTVSMLQKVIKAAQGVLDSTVDGIMSFIRAFENKYPEAPLNITDVVNQNPDYLKLNPTFAQELRELEDRVALVEDEAEIPVKEKRIEDIQEHIDIALGELKDLGNHMVAHQAILDIFRAKYVEYLDAQKEQNNLSRNAALKQEFLGTNSVSVQNAPINKTYNPDAIRDWFYTLAGTIAPSGKVKDPKTGKWIDSDEELEEHHKRANRFGFRVGVDIDVDNLYGYVVTSKTQGQILPGLTEHLTFEKKNLDNTDVVALVMVRKNDDGEFELMDEFGKPIPEDDKDKLNKAIYQTFPANDLPSSSFRENVSEEQKAELRRQYNLWRNTEKSKNELSPQPEVIQASFGIPKYVERPDSKGEVKRDYDVRTTAKESGLIKEETLGVSSVIDVVTSNETYQYGTTGYTTPLGRVFLKAQTGAVKLLNRTFNKKEANTMYEALLQMAKNVENNGTLKKTADPNVSSTFEIIDWLKSVVYWGVPSSPEGVRKEGGYNSIWYELVEDENGVKSPRLFISGMGGNFLFTSKNIEANKSAITALFESMYGNTNADLINKVPVTSKYREVIGFKNGKAIIRMWPNYQTFLLSEKTPEGSSRAKEDIPLVTNMKPLTTMESPNREGIYFIRKEAGEIFELKQNQPIAKPTSGTVADAKAGKVDVTPPATSVVPTNVAPGKFVLDGKAPNVKQVLVPDSTDPTKKINLGGVTFTFDGAKALEMMKSEDSDVLTDSKKRAAFAQKLANAKVLNTGEINEKLITAVVMNLGKPEIAVKAIINHSILQEVIPQLTVQSIPVEPPMADPAPTPETKKKVKAPTIAESISKEETFDNLEEEADKIPDSAFTSMEDLMAAEGTSPTVSEGAFQSVDELMAAEETPTAPESPGTPKNFTDMGLTGEVVPDDSIYRVAEDKPFFVKEDWGEVENFLATSFKNIPVYRIKNTIKSLNGRQVWGYFQKGAIYVYEGAETGTVYHEVFEAVWKAFAGPKEKTKILKEFKSRPGTFIDRESQKEIAYSKATSHQIKEQLAEEFRAKKLYNQDPPSYKGGNLIQRLFDDLINFIKTFFTGRSAISNTEKLFNKIGNGYYADINPYQYQLSLAYRGIQDRESATPEPGADLRVEGVPEVQVQELIQHMTFLTLDKNIKGEESLFAIQSERKADLYDRIKLDILGDPTNYAAKPGILRNKANGVIKDFNDKLITEAEMHSKVNNIMEFIGIVDREWNNLTKRHETYLGTFGISFDENDEFTLAKEDQSNKDFDVDARTVDAYRKANPTIKLLLSSLPKTKIVKGIGKDEKGNDIVVEKQVADKTSVNGFYLVPGDQVFINLMNKLHDSTDPIDMLNRLSDIALNDPTYANLYRVLTKNPPSVKVAKLDTSKYKSSDMDLISAFWKSFKKQNPNVVALYILPGGDIVIGDSSLASSAKQHKRNFFNSVVSTLRATNNPYVKYDATTQKYNATNKVANYAFTTNLDTYINFLNSLGIPFSAAEYGALPIKEQGQFKKDVEGIRLSLKEIKDFGSITTSSLSMEGKLMKLGSYKVMATKTLNNEVAFDSTYFGLNGERSQSFIGVNVLSNLYDAINNSKIKNIKDLANTPYAYLLTDVYTKGEGSVLMNKIFDSVTGNKIPGSENLLHPAYIDGTIDEQSGKKKESSKLSFIERLVQELNLNLNGYYSNLVPGDASIEWAAKMYDKESPFVTELGIKNKEHLAIFKNYFLAEMALAKDDRLLFTGRNNKDLRFFKDILRDPNSKNPDALHDAIVADNRDADVIYESKEFKSKIEAAIERFIEEDAKELEDLLRSYGIIGTDEGGMIIKKLDLDIADENVTQQQIESKLKFITVNYMIANTEFHKLLYSDPFQYKDELKRIKNFTSPRQALFDLSETFTKAYDATYNEGIDPEDTDFYTDFNKKHFDTITMEDPYSSDPVLAYTPFEDTDGGGNIIYKAYRFFRILAGDWSPACEAQYRHDMGYEKLVKGGATQEEIDKYEKNNPEVSDAYKSLKPIVAGNKGNGRNYNDILMDKYALVPYSFRILHKLNPNSNAIKLYNKWQREGIDYGVYGTGRKVGSEVLSPLYDKDGKFDETPYQTAEQKANPAIPQAIIKVPHTIMSVQAEIPSKEVAKTTEGVQVTQLATLDYMEAGMPIDFTPQIAGQENMSEDELFDKRFELWDVMTEEERVSYPTKEGQPNLYKEIVTNQKLLEVRIRQGYEKLLRKTGIKKVAGGFEISDRDKLIDTLTDEILKREVNENIIEAFEGVRKNEVIMEATPAYKQIRNILYSMANQAVGKKKITGKLAVQVSERLLEDHDIKVEEVKVGDKTVQVYNSENLKFYRDEEGKRVCEIMVGRWFKSDKTDKELLEFLNTTDEGKKILEGIGFRIPTQKQNSIDAFVIKQFLPVEFGDNVVIPAALVKKVGSDFDIDKLSMYFKNVKTGKDGFPYLVKMADESNSTPESRYINYINSNAKNVKDFVSAAKDQLGYNDLSKSISESRKEIKEDYENLKEREKDTSIFDEGYELFKQLPTSIKQKFWDQNDLFDADGIEGIEKIIQQSVFAEEIKKLLNENPTNTFNKTVSISGESTVIKMTAKEVSSIIQDMIDNYDDVLFENHLTKQMIDDFKTKVANSKGAKELLKEVKLSVAKHVAAYSDLETFEVFKTRSIEMQNTADAVDNAYQQSLFNLITHPLNFERLVVPNSAKPLSDLSNEVSEALGIKPIDYKEVGNMLKRGFMTRLRHAFVTGKQAIGIAAIGQTNHSQNQRSPFVIMTEKLVGLSKKDQKWLGDASINFEKYNSMMYKGKLRPTLSKAKNKAGEYISDIIGMFIDGYVDISKGPWIMILGATPNVAGTWLFLVKLGVPIRDIAFFINQPIIKDYLKTVESAGYSYLFIDDFVKAMNAKYKVTDDATYQVDTIPNAKTLKENLKKTVDDMDNMERAQQQFMLKEFLKYAKMSEQLFFVTQGSNYNTATFNDPFLLLQKSYQLEKARKTIFSSVDNILERSSIGVLKDTMEDVQDAYAEILISDKKSTDTITGTRDVFGQVLMPYIEKQGKDFLKISQKAVVDLFDWVVQTSGKQNRNKYIEEILIGAKGKQSASEEVMTYKNNVMSNPAHPLYNNLVLRAFSLEKGKKEGKTDALYIAGLGNKVYEQNLVINSFREIREQLGKEGSDLYSKIVGLTVLQSGLATSNLSFTHTLPYEDFVRTYNDILAKLDTNPTLQKFVDLKVFERVNWNNTDIVPFKRFTLKQSKKDKKRWFNPNMTYLASNLKTGASKGKIPMTINISEMSQEGNYDVITYTWELDNKIMPKHQKKEMRRKGDYSFVRKGLFQKVYRADGTPLIQTSISNGVEYRNYVYKAINAWGDSTKAREMYDTEKPSILDNDYVKVVAKFDESGKQIFAGEVDDETIVAVFDGNYAIATPEDVVSLDKELTINDERVERVLNRTAQIPIKAPDLFNRAVGETLSPASKILFDPSLPKVNIYSGTGENADLSNFAIRPFITGGFEYDSVEQYFQYQKWNYLKDDISGDDFRFNQGIVDKIFETKDGKEIKRLGNQVKGLDRASWDANSSREMRLGLIISFEQNPKAAQRLLDTGNAELTHEHANVKDKWRTEFPKLLMEVRKEMMNDLGITQEEWSSRSDEVKQSLIFQKYNC